MNIDLAIGNILTNDTLGDTPTRVASVAVQGDSDSLVSLDTPLAEVGLLTPQGGNLVLLGNGTYTYTPPLLNSQFTEVFDYTIIDDDGDTSTSTLTINGNGTGGVTTNLPSIDLDLDDNNTVNGNFRNVFVTENAGVGGAGVAVAVTDLDLGISADSGGAELTEVEIVITNAQVGDVLTVDTGLLGALLNPIDADPEDTIATNGQFKLTLTPQDIVEGVITVDDLPASAFVNALAAVEFDTSSTDTTEREISITATDTNGDTSTAVQANIAMSSTGSDIAPVANADVDDSNSIVDSDPTTGNLTFNVTTGNVLNNDDPGNTPTVVTSASDSDGNAITIGTATLTSQGGSLLLAANGSYVYTPPTLGLFDPGITEVFNYTITDDGLINGETSTSTLTINVNGGAPVINQSLTVDLNGSDAGVNLDGKFTLEGTAVAIADVDLTVSDSDEPDVELTEIKVLLDNAEVGDSLAVSGLPSSVTSSVSGLVGGKVQLTLSANSTSASLANFQTALAGVTFSTDSTDTTDRTILVTAVDTNGEQSVAAEANIAIAPMVELSVSSQTGSETNETGFTITATASTAVNGEQTIDLGISGVDVTASDYSLSDTQITIADGETTGSVTLTVVDDSVIETAETLALSLTNLSAGIDLGTTTSANLTIADNDNPPVIDLDGNDNNTTDGKFQSSLTLGSVAAPIADVDLTLEDIDSDNLANVEVTITNAQDGDELLIDSLLGSLPATVTSSLDTSVRGEVKLTLSPTLLDSLAVGTFATALSAVGFNTTSTSTESRNISVTATDTDGNTSAAAEAEISIDLPDVELSVSSQTGSEAEGTEFSITANAASGVSGDQTIGLDISGVEASDYSLSDSQIVIADGETTGSVTLTVLDDNEIEEEETLSLSLTNPSGGIELGTNITTNLTIADNDNPAAIDLDLDDDNTVNGKFQTGFTLGGGAIPIADGDLAIDDDGGNLASVEVVITNAKDGDTLVDTLLGTLPSGIDANLDTSVAGKVKLTLAPSPLAGGILPDLLAFETALANIGFQTTSTDPGDRNITVRAIDGDGNVSAAAETTVGINLANNASLTVDLDSNDSNSVNGQFRNVFVIGGSGVAVADADVAIASSGDPNLELDSVEVVLTNAQSGDELSLSNLPTSIANQVEVGLDTSVTGEVKLTLSAVDGAASLAVFQTTLASVNFRNTRTNPSTSDRQIEIIAKDTNGEQSTAASASIAVSRSADLLPIANADVNTSNNLLNIDLTAGEVTLDLITGNVLSNDNPGNPLTLVTSASVRGQGDSLITLDAELAQVTLLTSQGGSLVLAATGDYVYTPPTFGLNDPGITEVFNYTITDADGDTSTNTLTINPVNSEASGGDNNLIPNAQADTNVAVEGGIAINNNLLDNDGLGDNPTTITTAAQGSTNIIIGTPFITANSGVLTLTANGSYSYIPPDVGTLPSAGVTETIEYTITDADGDTSTSSLAIEVGQAAPIAKADKAIAVTGSTVTINVLSNDSNEGGAASAGLTVKLLDDNDNPVDNLTVQGQGNWSVQGDGTVLFDPVEGLTGDPTPVDYQVIDADGQASAAAKINLDYQDILGGKVAIERVSANDFYIDPDEQITSNYVAYKVTNTSDEDITELWVEIDDFAGGNIQLAANESSQINLGALASGEATTAFFYLSANGAVTTEQSHTVSAYDGVPEEEGIFQGDADFSFTGVADIDPDGNTAADNTINSVSISPSTALPGDTVTVTVDGQTGIIGDDGIISFTPASFTNWNPDTYELTDSSITFDGGNIGTVENQLSIQAPNADIGQNLPYTAIYTFEIAGVTDSNTELSPIGHISDGTEIKHTNTGNFDSFDFLPAVTGTGTVTGTVWDDLDYDGVFDAGEEDGVVNAKVNLYGAWNPNVPQETVTTGTGGAYQFANVPVGNYYLEFVEPKGFETTPKAQDGTGTGLLDSDVNRVTGRTDVFTLSADETVENLNAGVVADSDSDGIPNAVEGTESDRDNDGVPDYLDVDPEGYFYNQDTSEVIAGGLIEVSGPGEVDLRNDASETGYYQWFIDPDFPGTYSMEVTPPEGYVISPERPASDPPPIDATDLLPEDPYAIGSPRNESTNKLLSAEFADNPYYLTFDLEGGDPFIINNNIPFIAPPILDLDVTTTGNDSQTTYTKGGDSVSIIDSVDNVSLIDKDDLNLQGATIKLATRPDGDSAERLLVSGALPDGINTVGYDEGTGILELEGDAPLEDYTTALTQIEYSNDIELRESDRLIQISFSDGVYDSDIATSVMEFNTPPDIDLDGDSI